MLRIQKVLRITTLLIVLSILILISNSAPGSLIAEKLHLRLNWFNSNKQLDSSYSDKLLSENLELQSKLEEYDLKTEQNTLSVNKLIKSSVISNINNPWLSRYRVDKGSSSGVVIGQIAIDNGSLIGVVTEVTPDSSIITSIFDPRFSIIAKLDNSEFLIHYNGTSRLVAETRNGLSIEPNKVLKTAESGLIPGNIAIASISNNDNALNSNIHSLEIINKNRYPASLSIVVK